MKKIMIVLLISAFVAAPAIANGMYAAVNLGQSSYNFGSLSNNNQLAVGILGGYSINENFAAEVEYDNFGSVDYLPSVFKGSAVGISAVGSLYPSENISIFGKFGIASSTLKETHPSGSMTHKNSGMTFGFGAQYNVAPTIGFRVSFDSYPVGDLISGTGLVQVMSIGGVFKF